MFFIVSECTEADDFSNEQRPADIAQVYKKMICIKRKTMGVLVFYLLYLKYVNIVFANKFIETLTIYCQGNKCSAEMGTVLNIH